MGMSVSKLSEIVKDREAWRAEVHGYHSQIEPSEWTTTVQVMFNLTKYLKSCTTLLMKFWINFLWIVLFLTEKIN